MTDEEMRAQGFDPTPRASMVPSIPQANEITLHIAQTQAMLQSQLAQINNNAAVLMAQAQAQMRMAMVAPHITNVMAQHLGQINWASTTHHHMSRRITDGDFEFVEETNTTLDPVGVQKELNRRLDQLTEKSPSFWSDPIGYLKSK